VDLVVDGLGLRDVEPWIVTPFESVVDDDGARHAGGVVAFVALQVSVSLPSCT